MARVRLDIPEHLPFSTEILLRISDINYGGHLGNDAVLSIVHEARVRFFQRLGFTETNIAGRSILMVDASVVYRSEGFYGDVLAVGVGLGEIRPTGCDVLFRLAHAAGGKEIALAKTGIVFIDAESRTIVPIPEEFTVAYGKIAGAA